VRHRRLEVALAIAVLLPLAPAVLAQVSQQHPDSRPRIWLGGGGIRRFRREPPKWAKLENFDGSFNFCRMRLDKSGQPDLVVVLYGMTH